MFCDNRPERVGVNREPPQRNWLSEDSTGFALNEVRPASLDGSWPTGLHARHHLQVDLVLGICRDQRQR